jgi:ribonuclease R
LNPEEKTYEGIISVTGRGMGFFSLDPGVRKGSKDKQEDLLIPREWIMGAFHGDTVKVALAGIVDNRKAAKVLEIVKRNRETFVGTLIKGERGETLLAPDWKRMYTPFIVTGDNLPLGNKVLVRLTGWDKGQQFPSAKLEEIIGVAGVHETEMRALALSQGFHSEFPPGVDAEAKKLETTGQALIDAEAEKSARGESKRKDFRGTTTFTIDPRDAKDFDDALSVKDLGGGKTEVGIHIADVSYFVRPGTDFDKEARHRATSVYLVDRTIPMLPHVLSNNLCSLNEDIDRLAVSAVFVLDSEANILERWFGETVIHSDKRFAYEDAQEVLDTKEGPMLKELTTLKTLADKIRKRRTVKGAIAFDTAEVKIELDASGKPIAVHLKERRDTNLLIEDFMLLANEAVAEHLAEVSKKKGDRLSQIYRVHDTPDAERIENLAQFLRVLGYELENHAGRVKGADLNKLLKQVEGTPEEYLIKTATLRSMAKAVYTTKNIGHFGLAFASYTHFTSPIRRYPDLITHRILKHYENGEELNAKDMNELEEMAIHCSEREVSATEAERDSIKMKLVEFMADKIGQEFDAVISGVTERGMYVELKETHAEGMIRLSSIGDDYYTFDQARYRLVGNRLKKSYTLGDPVRVKLLSARLAERELDFVLAGTK